MTNRLCIVTLVVVLSLVLPTFNEAANITSLIDHLDAVLQDVPHEIIVVDDDSPDGTWKVAESLKKKHPSLRVMRRISKRGLSSAVVDGFDMARGDILVVMDADGQHDADLLHKMLGTLRHGSEIVIGSRYVPGGSVGDWVTDRRIISSLGTMFATKLSRVHVSDPLSGFFSMRTSLYKKIRPKLRPTGFKILLEILAAVPVETRVAEVPLIFRIRLHGKSKLSFGVHLAFARQVLRLALRRFFVGACGACTVFYFAIMTLMLVVLLMRFWNIRLLYSDASIRIRTETALRAVANHRGWLLSDIELTGLTSDDVTILHRSHRRTFPEPTRCTISLLTSELTCDALAQ